MGMNFKWSTANEKLISNRIKKIPDTVFHSVSMNQIENFGFSKTISFKSEKKDRRLNSVMGASPG